MNKNADWKKLATEQFQQPLQLLIDELDVAVSPFASDFFDLGAAVLKKNYKSNIAAAPLQLWTQMLDLLWVHS